VSNNGWKDRREDGGNTATSLSVYQLSTTPGVTADSKIDGQSDSDIPAKAITVVVNGSYFCYRDQSGLGARHKTVSP